MGSLHRPAATPVEQLTAQLEHNNAGAIWDRALEVFGEEKKARSWMKTSRDLFSGRTPEELGETDAMEQRRVLEVLLRIDYGVFSGTR